VKRLLAEHPHRAPSSCHPAFVKALLETRPDVHIARHTSLFAPDLDSIWLP